MAISEATIKKFSAQPGKPELLTIGGGLTLRVVCNEKGKPKKTWYLRYHDANGKRQRSKIGEWPELSLAKAMSLAEDAKRQAKAAETSLAKRTKAQREARAHAADSTFQRIAEKWLEKAGKDWGPAHAKRQGERLRANVFPVFGRYPIEKVTMEQIDSALAAVVARDSRETALRIAGMLKSVFLYAFSMQWLANLDLVGRLELYIKDMPKPNPPRHLYQDNMSLDDAGKLLLAIHESRHRWALSTSVSLRLAPYVALRPSELVEAEWAELDLQKCQWFIPGHRMKAGRDHIVPLSPQAVSLIGEIRGFSGSGRYVFPSPAHSRANLPITSAALVQALRRLGYASTTAEANSFTTHGFRGLFSTTLNQHPDFTEYKSEWIEHQLSHSEKDKVKDAYNRRTAESWLPERTRMMQQYADFLDNLRAKVREAQT